MRRKRFGSLNAMKNISLYIFAPSAEAVSKSLKNPKILEIKIPKLFVNIALNMAIFGYFVFILSVLRKFNQSLIKIESLIFKNLIIMGHNGIFRFFKK